MANQKQIDRLKQAFRGASAAWDEAAARTRPGEIACRAGCFGCCVGLFDISLPEAALVRAGVARLSGRGPGGRRPAGPADRRGVGGGLSRRRRARACSTPIGSEEADDDYFAVVADRACPMLELPSGRCRIYEERPITCRTYGFAWAKDGAVFHPPCGLNLPGASEERQLATSIDIGLLDQAEDVDAELAAGLGLEPGRETTIAHAVLGTAFGPPPG